MLFCRFRALLRRTIAVRDLWSRIEKRRETRSAPSRDQPYAACTELVTALQKAQRIHSQPLSATTQPRPRTGVARPAFPASDISIHPTPVRLPDSVVRAATGNLSESRASCPTERQQETGACP